MITVDPHDLGTSVAATRDRLKKSGIKANDRVAVLAPNSVEQFIFMLSVWQLRAIFCPMNYYQPKAVIKAQMAHINAHRLIDEKLLKRLVVIEEPGPSSS